MRIIVIGERGNVESEMMSLIDEARELTRDNTGLTLVIAFNYGSRAEIARAAQRLAEEVAAGGLAPGDITPERIQGALDTAGIPDPDVLIRTSGEMRLSNFLLWQIAYTELYTSPVLWPDFSRRELYEAILDFQSRDRRFGRVSV